MEPNINTPLPQSGEKKAFAKAYCSPQFVEYGNIQELTNAIGTAGMMDGGTVMGAKKS